MKKNKLQIILVSLLLVLIVFTQINAADVLSGRVYEGNKGVEPPISSALVGVTIKLYASTNPDNLGNQIGSTTTNSQGWYGLTATAGYEYYTIVETDPAGYYSVGATSPGGNVLGDNRIRFSTASAPLADQTLTGNKFWDKPDAPTNNPPVADVNGPYTGTVGQVITLDGSGSSDPDPGDNIVSYEWDLDHDGQYDDATGVTVQHTWHSVYSGTIGLRVTDSFGETDTDQTSVSIERESCNAAFTASPTQDCAPLTVNFSDQSGSNAQSWEWKFYGGSPSSSTQQNPSITYNTPGTYSVKLKITCTSGAVDSLIKIDFITVQNCAPPCEAAFEASPRDGCAPLTVNFSDLTGNAQTWLWKFRGGTPASSTVQNPIITYNTPGSYAVFLKVTCETGEVDSVIIADYILVRECQPDRFDFGDAPQSYSTLLVHNGARHIINDKGPWFGHKNDIPDYDPNGQPTSTANGDDNDGNDDENGFNFVPISPMVADTFYFVTLKYTTSDTAYINMWVDFNQNGNWIDASEHTITDAMVYPFSPIFNKLINIPATAVKGETFVRFRISSQRGLGFDGLANDGEVEDYKVKIVSEPGDPFGKLDSLGMCLQLNFEVLGIGSETINLSGPAKQRTYYAGSTPGTALDNDLNGIEEVVTELTSLSLFGTSPIVGVVKLTINPLKKSLGIIEEKVNNTANVLDISPFQSTGSANSFFDVYFKLVLPDLGLCFVSSQPIRINGVINHIPPYSQNIYSGMISSPVPFFKTTCGTPIPMPVPPPAPDGYINQLNSCGQSGDTSRIGDWVWNDANKNGLQDTGENGIGGVTVNLFDALKVQIGGATTIGNGFYSFSNLPAGTYSVQFILPPGYTFSPADQGADDTIDSDANQSTGETAQFILSAGDNLNYYDVGMYPDGASEKMDFGDAPDSPESPEYPTLLANNGARHILSPGFYLGTAIDADPNGHPSALSDGDDLNPPGSADDEDGVTMSPFIAPGQAIPITIVASNSGVINAWLDFNLDGDWADAGEHFIAAQPVIAGANSFTLNVPGGASFGLTYARFRFSSVRQLSYNGLAPDGEVEDYAVEIVEAQDGSVVVIKEANPKDNTPFLICQQLSGGFFNVLCGFLQDPLNNKLTILNPSQLISVSEATIPDWSLQDITVSGDLDGGSKINLASSTVDLDFDPGENIVITFKNQKDGGDDKFDFGDAPDPKYPTRLIHNGARHKITSNLYLGSGVDPENDGQPSSTAVGDNQNSLFPGIPFPPGDEDGVLLPPVITAGQSALITVVSSGPGVINAWLDFNIDGDWADAGEQIIPTLPVVAGINSFPINVPNSAQVGQSYARFRLSSVRNITFNGPAPDGEVEDYAVAITKGDGGKITIIKEATPKDDTPFWITTVFGIHGGAALYRDPSSNTAIIQNGPVGTYYMGESVPVGWELTDIVVTGDSDHGSVIDVTGTSAQIDLDAGEDITVVFKNKKTGGVNNYDFGDAPDNDQSPQYPTLHANGGAYHTVLDGFHLGANIDIDANGQPHPDALGDDGDGMDDEDGVKFSAPILVGQQAHVEVTASDSGVLNGWIDFNVDQDWADADDHIIINQKLNPGNNLITYHVPATTPKGETFARFRFSKVSGLLATGYGNAGEVEDYKIKIGKTGEGPPLKWSQPPLKSRNEDFPEPTCFFGWDELSILNESLVADDWFCKDPRPVIGIRWWGSYIGWDNPNPPEHAPFAFRISIWTDVPENDERPFSLPGQLIWDREVLREETHEHVVGCDFHPERMENPDSCFQYEFDIPEDVWFHQESDSAIYWLSIAAMYEEFPEFHAWGWKTRRHYFHDNAVRIYEPKEFGIGSMVEIAEPITYESRWDLAFELKTTEYLLEFDFGDAPAERYPTLSIHNAAKHLFDLAIKLGDKIDTDPDGQSHAEALGDDLDGMNDDDGIIFLQPLKPGENSEVEILASTSGFLNGWIDYNNNGRWNDPDEHILIEEELKAGSNIIPILVPAEALAGKAYSRFRFTKEAHVPFFGLAINGEVEDYLLEIGTVDAVDKTESIPTEFRLFQNYPNPFNSKTEIHFQLPKEELVKIWIYNLMGNEITVLVNEKLPAGSHSVIWNGLTNADKPMSSGIYIYRMEAGRFKDVKKLLYLK